MIDFTLLPESLNNTGFIPGFLLLILVRGWFLPTCALYAAWGPTRAAGLSRDPSMRWWSALEEKLRTGGEGNAGVWGSGGWFDLHRQRKNMIIIDYTDAPENYLKAGVGTTSYFATFSQQIISLLCKLMITVQIGPWFLCNFALRYTKVDR